VNFNDLPAWQRRGVGVVWEEYERPAVNPKTGAAVTATRRRLKPLLELPMRDEYSRFVEAIVAE
jgi:tRNA(His) 5'-end guanylyltransferase